MPESGLTIADALRSHARERPNDTAVTFLADGERQATSTSYRDLYRRATQVAATLRRMNLSGRPALLVHPPGLAFIEALYGCFYAGVVAVPTFPPRFRPHSRNGARFVHLIEDVKPGALLTTQASLAKAKWWSGQVAGLDSATWIATDSTADGEHDGGVPLDLDPASVAMLQYTSGSTRSPKGVVLTHRNLMANEQVITAQFRYGRSSHMLSWLPPYHDMGLIGGILQPITEGFLLTLMEPLHVLQRPSRWLEAMSQTRATTSGAPNSFFELCVRTIGPDVRDGLDLSAWTVAFNGSEPVRPETIERFSELFAPCGFKPSAFLPCYGLAESTLLVAGAARDEAPCIEGVDREALQGHRVKSDPGGVRLVSCGQPGPGCDVAIVDCETLRECPENRVGEIWVSGNSVAHGYWNRADETRDTFENSLPGRQGRFLRTGDLGFLRAGDLFVTGRLKDLIIVRGRNFYPQDIESSAGACHPALTLGACVAFSVDAPEGEGVVVACEVRREARHHTDAAEIIRGVRQEIADEFDLGLADVAIVQPGTLLRTTSGKIRRTACRQAFLDGGLRLLAPAPSPTRQTDEPVSLTDRIRRVIGTVLKIPEHWVEPEKPLAHLGIDSMMRLEVLLRLELDLSLDGRLDDSVVDDETTLTDLVRAVERVLLVEDHQRAGPRATVGVPAGQQLPLTPHQHEFLSERDSPEQCSVVLNLRTPRGTNPRALERAVQSLERQHDAFRLRFRKAAGHWVQEHGAAGTGIAFRTLDLRAVPRQEWGAIAEGLNSEIAGEFDLEKGPVVQAAFLDRGSGEAGMLFLSIHHLIADGVSIARLLFELERTYQSNPADGGDLSFAEWTQLLDGFAQSSYATRDLSHWQQVCGENRSWPPSLASGPRVSSPLVELDPSESRRWLDRSPASEQQHDFFLACAVRAWAEVMGHGAVFVRLESHGRFPIQGQAPTRTIGRFTCRFPVRIELPASVKGDVMLDRVRSAIRDVPNHGLSFGALKHLCRDQEVRRIMRTLPSPGIAVAYRGRLDDGFRGDSAFPVLAWHVRDQTRRSPDSEPAITLSAGVEGRTVWFRASSKPGALERDAIERLTLEIRARMAASL